MQAIILAAGMGKRLKELTQNNTKCMVKVNGVSLAERLLTMLDRKCLGRIVMVVGYEGKKLMEYVDTLGIKTPVQFIDNPIYDKTNNIYSLSLASKELCEDDTLLFESDLIFEESILDDLIADERDTLAIVDKYESWMDGTCMKLREDDSIEAFVPGSEFQFDESNEYYKTVNIYKFSKEFSKDYYVPFLEAYEKALGLNEYYEQVLRVITMLNKPVIRAKRLSGQKWYEIDDVQDLDIAESLFAEDDVRIAKLQERYGGYWRYPQMLDFCYLVNPYFPPKKMISEMKHSFEVLLTQYPSGMKVNALLASKVFGVHQDNIVIGNGAAELIKALMEDITGKIGVVRPTFEEYPNRYNKDDVVVFEPQNPDFSYTADDIMNYFTGKGLSYFLLINPDNPSGNYISRVDVLRLVDWAKQEGIGIIVDESFVDFADEVDSTLLEQELLERYNRLYVMKSISKSYGVPGIRLGVLASNDTETIAKMKKQVAIWNINSFGEFFMQIFEKYRKNYVAALEKLRGERAYLQVELAKIPGIRVIPSQANYVMVELSGAMSSGELTKRLAVDYNLLVKDLYKKVGEKNYLRLAVRTREDNDKFLDALRQVLQ